LGRERLIGPKKVELANYPTLSPDGRFFAAGTKAGNATGTGIRICEVVTGKKSPSLTAGRNSRLPPSRGRRTGDFWRLAPTRIRIRETTLRSPCEPFAFGRRPLEKNVASFGGINADVSALTFSPDGKLVVAGLSDSTILVFDASKADPRTKPMPQLGQAELDSHWTDLAGEDASKANRAAWSLVDGAKKSLLFLSRRLKPIPLAGADKIQKWIEDLSSDAFAVRDSATNELLKAGEPAEFLMEGALSRDLPLETRRRLKQILEKTTAPLGAETLRTIRAIMVFGANRLSSGQEHFGILGARNTGNPCDRRSGDGAATSYHDCKPP